VTAPLPASRRVIENCNATGISERISAVFRRDGEAVSIDLSIVLPIFNEVEVLERTIQQLHSSLAFLGLRYEILCIDDGSKDGTGPLLDQLANDDPCIVPIHFTRNFGKEAAIQAGIQRARGEAAIFMDADLQHPPDLIPQMVELWREDGYEVVEARKRIYKHAPMLSRVLALSFSRLLGGATGAEMLGASDFKLLSRQTLDTLTQMPEHHRYFRGLVHWIGFESISVEFDVDEREGGTSSWGALDLVRYAVDAILSFTTAPLVWIALMGVLTTALGSVLGGIALYDYISGTAVDGFTTVILMLVIFSGLILTSLGTMSLYLGRLFEEAKSRPLYVIRAPEKEALTESGSPPSDVGPVGSQRTSGESER
jgi:glycosyltransferase involved in cell wall biosynthesis